MHVVATPYGNREVRAVSGSTEWGPTTAPPPPAGWGGTGVVSADTALQIAAVYGCVDLLSSSVATLPLRLLNNSVMKNAKELPLSPLLTQPYLEISLFEWIVQFVASLALRGNFFGQIIQRDREEYAVQIKPIPADNVKIKRNRKNGALEYRFFNEEVPIDDVFHVKMLSMPGMLQGVNPIEALRLTFGLSLAQTRYGESFFRNSGYPAGVIQVAGKLGTTETEALLKNWLAAHQGLNKANLPAVLTEGAEFKPVTISPEDSQFLESRGFSASEISGMIYRVPPHMIGLVERSTSWGKGIEEQEAGFVRNTLGAYLGRLQDSLTALHPPKQYARFDLTHRLRGNALERAQTGSLGMLGGFFTANEVRGGFYDMPAHPDGDELFSPINTELLKAALAQVEAAEKAAKEPTPEVDPTDPALIASAKGGSA